MSQIEREQSPPNSGGREARPAAQTADAGHVARDAMRSSGGPDAPTTKSLGPGDWRFAAGLVIVVFLVYQPAWHGGFVWDDDLHLLDNPVLKPGGLAKVWVPGGYANYWPLTYTAYWLQFKLWGLNPLGFHLVNIAGHAVSALLVWRILVELRMGGARLAAALFALHPVNVESVAWIAQLKGVLALMLALVSVLFFLAQERQGGWWRSALALGAFWLSTLAKSMAIPLPVVLLACAWWQRGRITRRDLLHVLPYVLIGAVMAGTVVWSERMLEGNEVVRTDSFLSRTAVAGYAVWFYLGKVIWPLDLCFDYPRWRIDAPNVLSFLPGMLLGMLLALAWRRRHAWGQPILMLLICYVGLLLPVLGFVNIYFMLYSLVADHWQYAAMIAPCAMFASAAAMLARAHVGRSRIGYVLSGALLATLAVLTWRQSRTYADLETFFRATIEKNPSCWLAHNNLGLVLADRGLLDEAIVHYRKALEIRPNYAEAHNNLGVALAGRGRFDEAIAHFQKALNIKPDYANAHNNIGIALAGRGQVDEAIAHFQKALEIKPDYAEAHNDLGNALAMRGVFDEAIAQYRKALENKPDYAEAHNNLGNALADRGQVDEAIAHYRKALEIRPDYAEAHNNLGLALASRGRFDEAIAHFQEALKIKPDYANAHNNLGMALAGRGQVDEALAQYREVLRLAPTDFGAYNNLAWIRATHPDAKFRNGAEAVALARRAVELAPQNLHSLDTLAASYAEAGRYAEAVQTAHKALALAQQQHQTTLSEALRARLRLYEAGTPFHEPPPAATLPGQP